MSRSWVRQTIGSQTPSPLEVTAVSRIHGTRRIHEVTGGHEEDPIRVQEEPHVRPRVQIPGPRPLSVPNRRNGVSSRVLWCPACASPKSSWGHQPRLAMLAHTRVSEIVELLPRTSWEMSPAAIHTQQTYAVGYVTADGHIKPLLL